MIDSIENLDITVFDLTEDGDICLEKIGEKVTLIEYSFIESVDKDGNPQTEQNKKSIDLSLSYDLKDFSITQDTTSIDLKSEVVYNAFCELILKGKIHGTPNHDSNP